MQWTYIYRLGDYLLISYATNEEFSILTLLCNDTNQLNTFTCETYVHGFMHISIKLKLF